jgi:hypothetical protein
MAAPAIDTVYRKSTDKRTAGEIIDVSREHVLVKPKVGEASTIPANDIKSIEWEGEPAAMGLARAQLAAGQWELALDNFEAASREVRTDGRHVKADIAYGIASAMGRLALGDPNRRDAAVTQLRTFTEEHANHYRYFDAQLLLGEIQVGDDPQAAESAFQQVLTAPWEDYQMAANVGLGRTALARGDATTARTAFDMVVSADAATPAEKSRVLQAMLGQAACAQQEKQFAQAVEILTHVIHEAAADDTRLLAEAYLRQGDCYATMDEKSKYAVLAYLHLDVIPSLAAEEDLHAEALYKLSELWPQLGHPDRADLAAGKLHALYPESPWTAKLSGL